MTNPRLVVVGAQSAVPVIYASDGPALLRNRDPAVTVYLGDEGMSPGDSDTHILDPLGTLSVTGERDWWGITAAGSAIVQATPAAVDSNVSPSQIAAQIALAGLSSAVPALLSAPSQVATVGNPFGPLTFKFPAGAAYQLVFSANNPVNACMADITINHLDIAGNVVYTEDYTIGLGSLGNFSPVIVRGNLCGPAIQISGQLATGAQINALPFGTGPFTGTGLVMGVYSLAQALSPPTPKIIPSNTTSGILQAFQAINLAASSSSIVVPVFSYMGTAKWDVFTATAGQGRASIQFFKVAAGAVPQGVWRIQNDGKVAMWEEVEMIGLLGGFQVTNENSAAAVAVTSHLVAKEYI